MDHSGCHRRSWSIIERRYIFFDKPGYLCKKKHLTYYSFFEKRPINTSTMALMRYNILGRFFFWPNGFLEILRMGGLNWARRSLWCIASRFSLIGAAAAGENVQLYKAAHQTVFWGPIGIIIVIINPALLIPTQNQVWPCLLYGLGNNRLR